MKTRRRALAVLLAGALALTGVACDEGDNGDNGEAEVEADAGDD